MKIWLNGSLVAKEQAVVSVFDHGLLYGDGVFEGIRAYDGRVFKLGEHLARLWNSARAIMLEIPLARDALQAAVLDTLRANGLRDAYIRLVVTRGTGDLGLDPRKCPTATVFIIADTITLYAAELYERGLAVATVSTRRIPAVAVDPRIKSLNYLNNILAKIEANTLGVPEAIMLNLEGRVAECTGDNVFIVRRGRLLTPPIADGGLEGITRDTVLDLARSLAIPHAEESFTPYEIYTAEECFLTGTAAEIIPVVKVDTRPIGPGTPGPVTRRLTASFREMTRREGVPV